MKSAYLGLLLGAALAPAFAGGAQVLPTLGEPLRERPWHRREPVRYRRSGPRKPNPAGTKLWKKAREGKLGLGQPR